MEYETIYGYDGIKNFISTTPDTSFFKTIDYGHVQGSWKRKDPLIVDINDCKIIGLQNLFFQYSGSDWEKNISRSNVLQHIISIINSLNSRFPDLHLNEIHGIV